MKIIDKGVFIEHDADGFPSHTFPGICVLPSGRWLVSCRAAIAKKEMKGQHPLLSFSDDNGKTWCEPYNPFKNQSLAGKPGLFRTAHLTTLENGEVVASLSWVDHSNPDLPFFNEQTEGLLDTRIFISFSDDDGVSWSMPELMDTSPFNVPTPTTGPILSLSNGELACQFELNKHYYEEKKWRHLPILMFSKDEGKSWDSFSVTAEDKKNRYFYWDQRPSLMTNNNMLNLFWTFDTQIGEYLNIHASKSFDNGHSWSKVWDTGISGQPASPVMLPDGKVAMVYIDRSSCPEIKMRLSNDLCESWLSEELILYRHSPSQASKKRSMQDAWSEMTAFSAGLPATTLMENGDILIVYYAGYNQDKTDINWVRVKC